MSRFLKFEQQWSPLSKIRPENEDGLFYSSATNRRKSSMQ